MGGRLVSATARACQCVSKRSVEGVPQPVRMRLRLAFDGATFIATKPKSSPFSESLDTHQKITTLGSVALKDVLRSCVCWCVCRVCQPIFRDDTRYSTHNIHIYQ